MPKVPELLSATVHLLLTAYSCIQAFPVFGGWPRVKRSHGNPGHIKWSCNYECLPRDLSAWWRSCSSPLSTRLSLPFRLPVRRSARRPRSHTHTRLSHNGRAPRRFASDYGHGGLDKRDNNESRGRFEPIPPMPPIYNRGPDVTSSTCSHSWSSDVYASLLTFLLLFYIFLSLPLLFALEPKILGRTFAIFQKIIQTTSNIQFKITYLCISYLSFSSIFSFNFYPEHHILLPFICYFSFLYLGSIVVLSFSLSFSSLCLSVARCSRKHTSTHTKWKHTLSPFVHWHVDNRPRHRMIPVALLRRKAAFTNAAKLPAVVTLHDARIQQFGVYRSASFHRRSPPRCRPRCWGREGEFKTNLVDRPSLNREIFTA